LQTFSDLRWRRRTPGSRAFTLIELLVVVAIIMVLVGMLVPLLKKAREAARSAKCRSHMKALTAANAMYNRMYGCLSPGGYRPNNGGLEYAWYQKVCMGQFFGEDVPMYGTVDGRQPPAKSVLRCPSEAAWHGLDPDRSWIAYNGGMSLQFQPRGTDMRCYFRGPRMDEIRIPPSTLVTFQDGRGSGFLYCSRWAYNDRPQVRPPNVRVDEWEYNGWPYNCPDYRHDGGVNYGFADGRAQYFTNPDAAFAQHIIEDSIG